MQAPSGPSPLAQHVARGAIMPRSSAGTLYPATAAAAATSVSLASRASIRRGSGSKVAAVGASAAAAAIWLAARRRVRRRTSSKRPVVSSVHGSVGIRGRRGAAVRRARHVSQESAAAEGVHGRRWQKYDADEVAADALEEPLAVLGRSAEVFFAVARTVLAARLDEWWNGNSDEASVVKRRSRSLRDLLVELGPCYIKVGQALANRPDILRQDYMEELESLQDKVPPFPSDQAMQILREELGQDPMEVFAELSAEPVASASLGQVYRGRLRSTGEEVAVKVQRPNLQGKIALDLFIFRRLSLLLNDWASKNLGCNITLVVDEFAARLWEESDYVQEAQNLQMFSRNFATDPTVKIPRVCLEYTRERVITMEWINGVKSTDLAAMKRAGIDPDTFIRNGVRAALRQLLEFGLFHGDPHAGNLFALADGRIAYVDFGNVATLSKDQRDVMLRAITNVSNSDYKELANDFVNLGFLRPGYDTTDIVPAMAGIWRDSMGTSIRDFTFRMVTERFSRLVYNFPFRVPAQFSLVFRSLLMQEGICLVLNPDFSIIEVALPYVSRRLLSDPDPSLRKQLVNVVFKAGDGEGQRSTFQWDRVINLVTMAKEAQGDQRLFDAVVLDFCRGLRRDLLSGNASAEPIQVIRGAIEALVADDRLRTEEAFAVIDLLAAELSRDVPGKVLAALLQDTLQDVAKAARQQGRLLQQSGRRRLKPRKVQA